MSFKDRPNQPLTEAEEDALKPQGIQRWIIVLTVISASILELIDTTIVNVALTELMGSLGATLSEVSWVIASYAIANVIVVPLTAFFSRQFGRRNYFAGSLALFTIGSLMCGLSGSIWQLVFWRFVQGLGGGALLATSQTILVETFPKRQLGLANAIFGMGIVLGPTFGPYMGGFIMEHYSWHMIFFVNLPFGIIATLLTLSFVVDTRHGRTATSWWSMDWLGLILLIIGLGALQLTLEKGNEEDWFESTYITISAFTAAAALIGFVWRELTTHDPVVNLRVLKTRSLAMGTVLLFITGFGLYSSVFVYPLMLQQGLGYTAEDTGWSLLPPTLLTIPLMPFMGISMQKGLFPPKAPVMLGFFFFGCFCLYMAYSLTPQVGYQDFFGPLCVRSMGLACLMVPLSTLALSGLKGADIAQGAGITNMMRQLGGAFGVAIMSTLISHTNAVHRADLSLNMSVYNPEFTQRLSAVQQGLTAAGTNSAIAQDQAYKVLDLTVTKQAYFLSYMDAFTVAAIACFLCIPVAMLIKSKRMNVVADAH